MTDQDNSYTVSKPKIIEGPEGDQIKLVVERGRRPGFLKSRKPPRYPPPEVLQLIHDVRRQIRILWEAMKIDEHTYPQEAAIEYYRKQSEWLFGEEVLHDEYIYDWRLGQEPGDFRGRLLRKIIKERFPDLPPYGYVKLEQIARSFDKK